MAPDFFRSAGGRPRLFLCIVFMGAASIAPAQSGRNEGPDVAALRAEVQRLALELLQHRAEFTHWKMQWMNGELQQVQAERLRLGSERQLVEREIGELNLAATNGPAAEDESRKEELDSVQRPALLAGERAVTMREATLVGALNAESARMTEIQKKMQSLAAQPPKPK